MTICVKKIAKNVKKLEYGEGCLLKEQCGRVQNFMAGATVPPTASYNAVESGFSSYTTPTSLYSTSNATAGHSAGAYGSHYSNSYAY